MLKCCAGSASSKVLTSPEVRCMTFLTRPMPWRNQMEGSILLKQGSKALYRMSENNRKVSFILPSPKMLRLTKSPRENLKVWTAHALGFNLGYVFKATSWQLNCFTGACFANPREPELCSTKTLFSMVSRQVSSVQTPVIPYTGEVSHHGLW